MKKVIALIMSVIMTAFLTGCEITDRIIAELEETGAEETEMPAQAEEYAEEDISNSISVGIIGFDTFNPLLTESETVKECMQLVYEPLFDVDDKLRPVNVLAESYTVSPDGRTIEITTRSGVTWHDGSAFNAYDVAYTIKQIRSGQTSYTDNLANVADYKAIDDNMIRIVLRYAVPDFVSLLNFPIVKYQSEMRVNPDYIPIGTGAFRYAAQISTGKLAFSAYDGNHNGRAHIDTLYVYTLPDIARYESMFEASEIDLMTGDTVDLSEYTPRGSATDNEYVTNKLTFAGFNTQNPLLFGANTRKGLAELIDKESIVNSTIYSRGVAVDVPINPSSLFYYDTNTKFRRDELLALSYLGNDGWGTDENGKYVRTISGTKQTLEFELLTNGDSAEKTAIAEKIARDYTEVGIPVQVKALPYEEYVARIGAKNFDMMIGEIEIAPNHDLSPLITSAGNYFSYTNTDLDTLVGQMGLTHDDEQLAELMKQYSETIMDEMPFSALFFRKGDVLSGSKLKTELVPSITRHYRNVEFWEVK